MDDGLTARAATTTDTAGRALDLLARFGLLAVLVFLLVAFSALKPETFGTWSNLRSILSIEVTVLLLAFAATLPLTMHQLDLSIVFVFSFAQVLTVGLVLQSGWPVPAAIGLALLAALVVGLVNGLAVARFGFESIIATLASGSIVAGITLAYSGGEAIYGTAPGSLTSIARNSFAGLPLPVIYAAIVAIALTVVLVRFPAGRRMQAIGANQRAAQRSGIVAERYVIAAFVGSALLAAAGGILLGARLGAANADAGFSLLIPAFAGAFLGATAFWPGRFNIPGTATGVLMIAVAVTGLQQIGVALWVEPVFEGMMLFVAVGLAAWAARLRTRRARAARLRELERRAAHSEAA